ncbi:MAG: bifunctional DNA-formamidopyrimidine glycosylase/DNA-(apurinic or apyrimidinic site) lyase [Candidatus Cloacimonetes bacterium]|nr:bifunctional DNA-formamidopyrimidine glycosylase/DNA-(apurinic or apyrimidinic site) lyase [Candidatus Cloacimonadota bacterium]
MPELPEVQTIVNGLNKKGLNKKIVSMNEIRKGTIQNFVGENISEIGVISSIKRRGKYIIIKTSKKLKLIIHLRMTGKLIFETELTKTSDHTRAELVFSDNTKLIFDDVRAFGKIQIYNKEDEVESLEKLGLEPFSKDFNEKYLKMKFKNRKSHIKSLLLNQRVVAGLGNIYVNEILYRARISPKKKGNQISLKKLKTIVEKAKEVLEKAIKHNGTTISDYRSVEDKTGKFQNFLKVYQKEYCECGHQIKKVKQAGRSTYYCPVCQK